MKIQLIALLIIVGLIFNTFSVFSSNSQNDELVIGEVSGGFARVKAEIVNSGDVDISNVEWSISISGGLLGRINKTNSKKIKYIFKSNSSHIWFKKPK